MEALKNIYGQLQRIWRQASPASRVAISVTATVSLTTILAVGYWSSRPQYVALASGLAPSEVAEIISQLDTARVPWQMNYSGSAILVPRSQWNEARIAAGDQIDPSAVGPAEFENSLLGDPDLNHFRMMRHQELVLARTIERMAAISKATVHISQPESSPFIREQSATTASVVLEPAPGGVFSREQTAAIVSLLANSIEGLRHDDISVVDTRGRLLSSPQNGLQAEVSSRFDYQRAVESELAAKADMMLAEMLGPRHAVVRVTADIDFTETAREETVFDAESKVKKSEKTRSVSRTGTGRAASGAAGTASNIGSGASGAKNQPYLEKEEENETEYENAKTVDTVRQVAGTIQRLTVAAMVDLPDEAAGDASSTTPANPVTAEQVKAIIQRAIGFDATRGDEIEVLITELAGTIADPAVIPATNWEQIRQIIAAASLGIASLVALVLGLLTLKRLRPVAVPGAAGAGLSPSRARMLAQLSEQAAQNPEAVSRIIAAWLNEPIEQADESPIAGRVGPQSGPQAGTPTGSARGTGKPGRAAA